MALIRYALLPAVSALMVGCASSPPYDEPPQTQAVSSEAAVNRSQRRAASSRPPATPGSRAAEVALSMIGVPYRYGGATPRGFDCSGLVQYSFQEAGVEVPRTTEQQLSASNPIQRHNAQPGDLFFFKIERKISHVGIYVGDGRFVHAPSTGKRVEVSALENPYYRDRLVDARRFDLPMSGFRAVSLGAPAR